MTDDEACVSCHERPPEGYTTRNGQGIYLANLCRKCWIKGYDPEGKKPFENFHNLEGRS